MARHLSIGTVIDKNKISSDEVFIILVDALIKDENAEEVTTLSFCKNSENIVYNGTTYQASSFEINIAIETNTEPSIKLSAQDHTRTLTQYIEAYGGCVGSDVTITVINTASMDAPPEIQETFKILSGDVNEYVVELELGTENSVNKRFPQYRQFRDRCSWKYKGPKCGYTGGMATCDYTLLGANGCSAHNNSARFGGFPSLGDSA